MPDYRHLNAKAIKIARQTIRMCTEAGSGHPSSGLSLLHLTVALMYRILRYDPADPWNIAADRLIFSEGHAVPVFYAAYCELNGVAGTPSNPISLTFDDALSLRDADSVLDGHPNPAVGFPYFDAATGSLGQGLSVAAGLALAARLQGLDKRIFTFVGDGESREGQVTEALDFIIDHNLTNVIPIFNCNRQGQSDYVSEQQSAHSIAARLTAMNFDVRPINGHDWDQIFDALATPPAQRPFAVVASTVKGWGSSELSSKNYHGKPLAPDQLDQAMAEFDALAKKLNVSESDETGAFQVDDSAHLEKPQPRPVSAGSFADACRNNGLESALEKKKLATRRAYGLALAALGDADERIVALDGDVKNSTFASFFAKKHPDRFFECRIAEQNMVSTAGGLAAAGLIPFASTFAKFLVRAYDQLEMLANSNLDIKLCGSHAGVSLAADGPSQMGLPDVAFVRAFAHSRRADGSPMIHFFHPADAVAAFKLTELMANTQGLCYMRTHRPDVPFLYDPDESFDLSGFKLLQAGRDLTIVASGYMVHVARQAIELLAQRNIQCTLIDAYYLPLATDPILDLARDTKNRILVVEDNYAGGFGDEIATAAAATNAATVHRLFATKAPKSARSPQQTLAMVNLNPEHIANAAQQMLP